MVAPEWRHGGWAWFKTTSLDSHTAESPKNLRPTAGGRRLLGDLFTPCGVSAEYEMEALVAQPGNSHLGFVEAGRDQQGVVGTLLKMHPDCPFVDFDVGRRVDEIAKQMTRLDRLITIADALAKIAIEAARHQSQLQVAVNLQ